MNNFSLTTMLAEEHRAELLRQAERYRRAHDAKGESRRIPKRAKLLWLAAFCRHTARPVAVSEGIPRGTTKTGIRQGPCPPRWPAHRSPHSLHAQTSPRPHLIRKHNRHESHLLLASIRLVPHSATKAKPHDSRNQAHRRRRRRDEYVRRPRPAIRTHGIPILG